MPGETQDCFCYETPYMLPRQAMVQNPTKTMSGSPGRRGRTNPMGNDDSSESEEDGKCLSSFSVASAERFRSKVLEYEAQADFPTPPLYHINEEVYRVVLGQTVPAGPYIVTAILDDGRYKLKHKDNGQEHAQPIDEKDIVIRVPTPQSA